MKKNDLAKRMARARGISKARAADRIDSVVHRILQNLRSGETASLPGVGTFKPGSKPQFQVDTESHKGSPKKSG